jgi:hypothetical protein
MFLHRGIFARGEWQSPQRKLNDEEHRNDSKQE